MTNVEKIAKCPGRDRFMPPSTLLALLNADLERANAEALHAKQIVDAARKSYSESMSIRRNLMRRLATAERNPRTDVPEAFARLIGGLTGSEQGCIEWDGLFNANGYGQSYMNGKAQLAHRISFVISNALDLSEINGVVIRHKCDNPRCINPLHLESGTQLDNVRDMHARGRYGYGAAKGSANAGAKLSEEDIPMIRERLKVGHRRDDIAADFGVSRDAIFRIQAGTSWSHV